MKKFQSIALSTNNISDLCKTFSEKFKKAPTQLYPSLFLKPENFKNSPPKKLLLAFKKEKRLFRPASKNPANLGKKAEKSASLLKCITISPSFSGKARAFLVDPLFLSVGLFLNQPQRRTKKNQLNHKTVFFGNKTNSAKIDSIARMGNFLTITNSEVRNKKTTIEKKFSFLESFSLVSRQKVATLASPPLFTPYSTEIKEKITIKNLLSRIFRTPYGGFEKPCHLRSKKGEGATTVINYLSKDNLKNKNLNIRGTSQNRGNLLFFLNADKNKENTKNKGFEKPYFKMPYRKPFFSYWLLPFIGLMTLIPDSKLRPLHTDLKLDSLLVRGHNEVLNKKENLTPKFFKLPLSPLLPQEGNVTSYSYLLGKKEKVISPSILAKNLEETRSVIVGTPNGERSKENKAKGMFFFSKKKEGVPYLSNQLKPKPKPLFTQLLPSALLERVNGSKGFDSSFFPKKIAPLVDSNLAFTKSNLTSCTSFPLLPSFYPAKLGKVGGMERTIDYKKKSSTCSTTKVFLPTLSHPKAYFLLENGIKKNISRSYFTKINTKTQPFFWSKLQKLNASIKNPKIVISFLKSETELLNSVFKGKKNTVNKIKEFKMQNLISNNPVVFSFEKTVESEKSGLFPSLSTLGKGERENKESEKAKRINHSLYLQNLLNQLVTFRNLISFPNQTQNFEFPFCAASTVQNKVDKKKTLPSLNLKTLFDQIFISSSLGKKNKESFIPYPFPSFAGDKKKITVLSLALKKKEIIYESLPSNYKETARKPLLNVIEGTLSDTQGDKKKLIESSYISWLQNELSFINKAHFSNLTYSGNEDLTSKFVGKEFIKTGETLFSVVKERFFWSPDKENPLYEERSKKGFSMKGVHFFFSPLRSSSRFGLGPKKNQFTKLISQTFLVKEGQYQGILKMQHPILKSGFKDNLVGKKICLVKKKTRLRRSPYLISNIFSYPFLKSSVNPPSDSLNEHKTPIANQTQTQKGLTFFSMLNKTCHSLQGNSFTKQVLNFDKGELNITAIKQVTGVLFSVPDQTSLKESSRSELNKKSDNSLVSFNTKGSLLYKKKTGEKGVRMDKLFRSFLSQPLSFFSKENNKTKFSLTTPSSSQPANQTVNFGKGQNQNQKVLLRKRLPPFPSKDEEESKVEKSIKFKDMNLKLGFRLNHFLSLRKNELSSKKKSKPDPRVETLILKSNSPLQVNKSRLKRNQLKAYFGPLHSFPYLSREKLGSSKERIEATPFGTKDPLKKRAKLKLGNFIKQKEANLFFKNRFNFLKTSEAKIKNKQENNSNSKSTKEAIKDKKKKRRLTKQKRKTNYRLKRKRFHPRPAWIKLTMYKKFLKYRHRKVLPSRLTTPYLFDSHQKPLFFSFYNLPFPIKNKAASKPVSYIFKEAVSSYIKKTPETKQFESRNPIFPSISYSNPVFSSLSLIKKSSLGPLSSEKKLRDNRNNSISLREKTLPVNKKGSHLVFPITTDKAYYNISQSVFSEFRDGLWKSSWLRSNLNSYLRKIKNSFLLIKKTSKKSEFCFSKPFLTQITKKVTLFHSPAFLGKKGEVKKEPLDFLSQKRVVNSLNLKRINKLLPLERKATTLNELPGSSTFFFNRQFFLRNKESRLTPILKWKNLLRITEYNQITYNRIQQIISNLKKNVSDSSLRNPSPLGNQNTRGMVPQIKNFDQTKQRPFNNARHKLKKPIKKDLTFFSFVTTAIEAPQALKDRIHKNLSEHPLFTIQPFGNMSRKRVYWALNKSHMWQFKNSNKKEYLWANQKQREQAKSDTKKIIRKILTLINGSLQEQYTPPYLLLHTNLQKLGIKDKKSSFSLIKEASLSPLSGGKGNKIQDDSMGTGINRSNIKKLVKKVPSSSLGKDYDRFFNSFLKKQKQKENKMGDLGFLQYNDHNSNLVWNNKKNDNLKQRYKEAFLSPKNQLVKDHKLFLRNLKNTLRVPKDKNHFLNYYSYGNLSQLENKSDGSAFAKSKSYVKHNFLTVSLLRANTNSHFFNLTQIKQNKNFKELNPTRKQFLARNGTSDFRQQKTENQKMAKQSQLFIGEAFLFCTIIFHLCSLFSLVSISQIRDVIKILILVALKFSSFVKIIIPLQNQKSQSKTKNALLFNPLSPSDLSPTLFKKNALPQQLQEGQKSNGTKRKGVNFSNYTKNNKNTKIKAASLKYFNPQNQNVYIDKTLDFQSEINSDLLTLDKILRSTSFLWTKKLSKNKEPSFLSFSLIHQNLKKGKNSFNPLKNRNQLRFNFTPPKINTQTTYKNKGLWKKSLSRFKNGNPLINSEAKKHKSFSYPKFALIPRFFYFINLVSKLMFLKNRSLRLSFNPSEPHNQNYNQNLKEGALKLASKRSSYSSQLNSINLRTTKAKNLILNRLLKNGFKQLGSIFHSGLAKFTEIQDTGIQSILNLIGIGKRNETSTDWINNIFLIESASSIIAIIPETTDVSIWNIFTKLAKSSSLRIIPVLGTLLEKRLFSSFELLIERLCQPDTDIIDRQQKGKIFLDIWGEVLKSVAEENNINMALLPKRKEDQSFLLSKLLENDIQKPKLGLLPKEDFLELNKNKASGPLNSSLSFFASKKKNSKKGKGFNLELEGSNIRPFLRGLETPELFPLSFEKRVHQQVINKMKIIPYTRTPLANLSTNWRRWSANQYIAFKGKDTDLLIQAPPAPKSFHSLYPTGSVARRGYNTNKKNSGIGSNYNFNASSLIKGIAPLGTIICQIYSGLFLKETAKNFLIVGTALNISSFSQKGKETTKNSNYDQKSLLIQSLAGETEMKIIRDNANRYNFAFGIKSLRNVFDALALHTPCIFLIEDIHVIGERRPLLDGDDENAASSVASGEQSSGTESQDEKNLSMAKLTRHSVMHFRKPFHGDYSFLIPANNFSFDLFLGVNSPPFGRAKQNGFTPLSPISLESRFSDSEKKSLGKENFITRASNLQSTFQGSKRNFFLKTQNTVKELPWIGLSEQSTSPLSIKGVTSKPEGQNSLPRIKYSIRLKIALLASLAVSNLSVKLNMITDLLVIIDSVRSNRGFVVFATTHTPSILDPALRRPGRLDETIALPFIPKLESRWEIVKSNVASLNVAPMPRNPTFFYNGILGCSLTLQEEVPLKKIKQVVPFFGKTGQKLDSGFPNGLTVDLLDYGLFNLSLSNLNLQTFKIQERLTDVSLKKNNLTKISIQKPFLSLVRKHKPVQQNRINQSLILDNILVTTQLTSFNKKKNNKNQELNFINKRHKNKINKKSSKNSALIIIKSAYSKIGKFLINNKFAISTETNLSLFSTLHAKLENQTTLSGPSITEDSVSPYLYLFTNQENIKQYLMGLFAPKVTETLAFSSGSWKKRHIKNTIIPSFQTTVSSSQDLIPISGLESLQGIDKTWRAASSLIFTLVEKRLIYKKSVIIPKLLQFYNAAVQKSSLQDAPSAPVSSLLLPAKRYENYKRSFLAMQFGVSASSDYSLYNYPSPLPFGEEARGEFSSKEMSIPNSTLLQSSKNPQTKKKRGITTKAFLKKLNNSTPLPLAKPGEKVEGQKNVFEISSSSSPVMKNRSERKKKKGFNLVPTIRSKELGEEFLDKPTIFNGYYRSRILDRHRGYLNNQWWNGQLDEYSVETTFLSDIEWRTNFVASLTSKKEKQAIRPSFLISKISGLANKKQEKEDSFIDFPDFDQHYNPGNRRWVLHFGYWSYWYNFKTTHNSEIYSYMVTESFLTTFNFLNSNREIIDYFVTKIIKHGLIKEISIVDGLKRF